ncbi:MAG: DUF1330 domain-containing protein [Opitutaceae bacterium]|nr:DUF1330 domain-containing protein [Opitutaceae bacterium]
MSAYIILNYTVEDAAAFAAYQAEARDYVLSSVLDFLVYETDTEIIEGNNVGHQTVIFRFNSPEKAREFYNSKEYQKALPLRLRSTSKHFAILVSDRPKFARP